MKIFITGVAGFLGSHLAKRMLELGHEVSGNDNMLLGDKFNIPKNINFYEVDCCDYKKILKLTKKIDVVYHCAATAHEGLSVFSPNFITKNIYQASISVITASIVNKVQRFVYCSSMARYGSQKSPFTETMKPMPVDPYGIAKVAGEDTLINLCKVHGMEYNIAIPHNIVGPNQKYDDPFRNVMSIFINRNLQRKPSIIYGDGEQKRSFTYVDDAIFCLEKLGLEKNVKNDIFNIGPDEEDTSINKLAEMIANEIGYNETPIYVKERPQEVKIALCSADKARKVLNYRTKTSLTESIRLTTDFIKKRGVKKFNYKLPIEIKSSITPKTWVKKIM